MKHLTGVTALAVACAFVVFSGFGTGIERITTFLEPSLMPTFGLPMTLEQPVRM